MSDHEGHGGGLPPSDEDLSLPKATVAKMITGKEVVSLFSSPLQLCHLWYFEPELLPKEVACAKETRDLIIECCVGEEPRNSCQ